jgi:hypothetical protein
LILTIPSEIGLLSDLKHLDISLNGLSGFVADEFYNLSSLKYLDLSWQSNNYYVNCTTSDGSVVEPLYQLGDPDNDYNIGLRGKFLEEIGRLRNLVHINLDQNSFEGSILPYIEDVEQLGKFKRLRLQCLLLFIFPASLISC